MTFNELIEFLIAGITVFVELLTQIKIAGIPLIAYFAFFGVLSMVLVIVFRVKDGDMFDGL